MHNSFVTSDLRDTGGASELFSNALRLVDVSDFRFRTIVKLVSRREKTRQK